MGYLSSLKFLFFLFLRLYFKCSDSSTHTLHVHPSTVPPPPTQLEFRIFSHKYITSNLIKLLAICFLWVLFLFLKIICVNVRFVTFESNLSIVMKRRESKFASSHNFQLLVYGCTFLSLFEPFFIAGRGKTKFIFSCCKFLALLQDEQSLHISPLISSQLSI